MFCYKTDSTYLSVSLLCRRLQWNQMCNNGVIVDGSGFNVESKRRIILYNDFRWDVIYTDIFERLKFYESAVFKNQACQTHCSLNNKTDGDTNQQRNPLRQFKALNIPAVRGAGLTAPATPLTPPPAACSHPGTARYPARRQEFRCGRLQRFMNLRKRWYAWFRVRGSSSEREDKIKCPRW